MGSWTRRPDTEDARTFVVCRCGVDMELDWPPDRDAIRCFGCGARFERPAHLPPTTPRSTWNPHAFSPAGRARRFLRAHLVALLLIAAAAILLALGLAVWAGAPN